MDQGTERGIRTHRGGIGQVLFIGGPCDGERRADPGMAWYTVAVRPKPPNLKATVEGVYMQSPSIEHHIYKQVFIDNHFPVYVHLDIGPRDVIRLLLEKYPAQLGEVTGAYQLAYDGEVRDESPLTPEEAMRHMRVRMSYGAAEQLMERKELLTSEKVDGSTLYHFRAIVMSIKEYIDTMKKLRYYTTADTAETKRPETSSAPSG